MGQQDGVIKIIGQVDGLSFFKTKRGHQVRKKGGISADRIKNDPAFARTRENGQEFARAGQVTRLLRASFRSVLLKNADSLMASRLMREMIKVVQADTVHARGLREVQGPNTTQLEGFEFNAASSLASTLHAPFTAAIDRVGGTLSVTVPEFIPQDMITAPQGSTHARITAAGVELNLASGQYIVSNTQSDAFVLNEQVLPAITLSPVLPANSPHPLFLAFGIAFFQEVNGSQYPLKNGAYNAMALVKIDGGV
jgi:hypothetical protein